MSKKLGNINGQQQQKNQKQNRQTMIYIAYYRKLKIWQHEHHIKST